MAENVCNSINNNRLSQSLDFLMKYQQNISNNYDYLQTDPSFTNFTSLFNLSDNLLKMTKRLEELQKHKTSKFGLCDLNNFLWIFLPPIIFLFGSLGNILAFLVLRHSSNDTVSAFIYLSARSVVDEIVLIIGLLRRWIDNLSGYKIENTSNLMCKMINFLGTSSSLLSVWLTVTLTAERAFVVSFPLHVTRIIMYARIRNLIYILSLICILLSVHFFITVGLLTNCDSFINLQQNMIELNVHEQLSNHTNVTNDLWSYINNNRTMNNPNMSVDVNKIINNNDNNNKCNSYCTFLPQYNLFGWYWTTFDAITYSYLPFCLIMALNTIILHFVYTAKRGQYHLRTFKSIKKHDSKSNGNQISTNRKNNNNIKNNNDSNDHNDKHVDKLSKIAKQNVNTTDYNICLQSSPSKQSLNKRPTVEHSYNVTQLTIMLLVVSFTFLFTTVSIVLVKLLAQILDLRGPNKIDARIYFQLADTIAELFMYLNHALNFYLFCSTGKRFRTRLILLFTRFKREGLLKCFEKEINQSGNINIRFVNVSRAQINDFDVSNRQLFVITKSHPSSSIHYDTPNLIMTQNIINEQISTK